MMAYRHALRVSELVALRWDQVDLEAGLLHVRRQKNGVPSTHLIRGPELRALRELRRRYPGTAGYLFVSERCGPLTTSTVRKMIARAGDLADIGFPVHPHMLRHATGFYLAGRGMIPEPFSTTWGIGTSSTPSATPSWCLTDSRSFGGISSRF